MERSFPKKKPKVNDIRRRGFVSKNNAKERFQTESGVVTSSTPAKLVEEYFDKPTSQSAGFAPSSCENLNTDCYEKVKDSADVNIYGEKSLDEFRKDMAAMPMKEVEKLKTKLGLPLFNKTFFSNDTSITREKTSNTTVRKRKNPKRPREVSSKIPVSKFRNIYEGVKAEKIKYDPRFDNRCGEFNQHIYETNFGFLDELRENEKEMLKTELDDAKEQDPMKAEKIKEALKRMADRERTKADIDRRKEVIRELRRENNERLRQGMKPVFKTRAEVRKKVLERKFVDLKKKNRLHKFLRKCAIQFNLNEVESEFVGEPPTQHSKKAKKRYGKKS